jgi:carboxypeptidase C (cathepsin A)
MLLCVLLPNLALAQRNALPPAVGAAAPATPAIPRLPASVTTHHSIDLPGRSLKLTATAGAVTLTDNAGVPQAQIGFIAYALDDQPPEKRPVSFAMNGGPGTASAWLQLGLLGPWRMRMDPEAAVPSAPAVPSDNADTWLDFTDLVFIDPVGTGFSKLLVNNDDIRKKYWSVNGDVSSVAEAIRLWLTQNKRMASPKYIIGESYSGLRGPRLVRELINDESVGISGLVLISPKLDYGGGSNALDPLSWVAVLPSEAATARSKKGPVTRADMADVEAYAAGDYLVDLLRGDDPAAIARRVDRVVALTGLDRALVERRHGMVQNYEYVREYNAADAKVASLYDATVTKLDPFPTGSFSNHPDPMTDALQPAFVSAILDIYARRLNWLPEAKYEMSNGAANRAWEFGNAYNKPESVTYLRQSLAQDVNFHVLIGHGLFDVITPYFETQMLLNQIPHSVGTDRIDFEVYPGGHMFYSRDASRAAFREAAKKLYGAP